MIMTTQQQDLFQVLQQLGQIRMDQMARILRRKYKNIDRAMVPMVRQLTCYESDVNLTGDCLSWGAASFNQAYIDAIDVMLAVAEDYPLSIVSACPPPSLLRFSLVTKGEKIRLFSLVPYDTVTAYTWMPSKTERVIFLVDGQEIPPHPPLDYKYFFAIKQKDTYEFFTDD